jgi:hypothetical protein
MRLSYESLISGQIWLVIYLNMYVKKAIYIVKTFVFIVKIEFGG